MSQNNGSTLLNWESANMQSEGLRTEVVSVTPELATIWLASNRNNRTPNRPAVEQMAGAIKRGEWVLNGEAIKIGADGGLIDGQHRCMAIVEAGLAVQSLVVYGLDAGTQETVDLGRRRTLANMLQLRGESHTTMVAAALNVIYRIRVGGMKRAGTSYPTPQQALKILEDEPGIREGAPLAHRLNARLKVPAGLGCALYYLFSEIDPEDAETFFDKLMHPTHLSEGDPIYVLRGVLEKRANQRQDRARMEIVAAIMIKAWNAWRAGEEMKRLYWTPGGSRPEPFPKIR